MAGGSSFTDQWGLEQPLPSASNKTDAYNTDLDRIDEGRKFVAPGGGNFIPGMLVRVASGGMLLAATNNDRPLGGFTVCSATATTTITSGQTTYVQINGHIINSVWSFVPGALVYAHPTAAGSVTATAPGSMAWPIGQAISSQHLHIFETGLERVWSPIEVGSTRAPIVVSVTDQLFLRDTVVAQKILASQFVYPLINLTRFNIASSASQFIVVPNAPVSSGNTLFLVEIPDAVSGVGANILSVAGGAPWEVPGIATKAMYGINAATGVNTITVTLDRPDTCAGFLAEFAGDVITEPSFDGFVSVPWSGTSPAIAATGSLTPSTADLAIGLFEIQAIGRAVTSATNGYVLDQRAVFDDLRGRVIALVYNVVSASALTSVAVTVT